LRQNPMTHDYKRHGTTTLFAAFDVKTGQVIGDCMSRHRANEFLKFLRNIDKAAPARRDIHLVLDSEADQVARCSSISSASFTNAPASSSPLT